MNVYAEKITISFELVKNEMLIDPLFFVHLISSTISLHAQNPQNHISLNVYFSFIYVGAKKMCAFSSASTGIHHVFKPTPKLEH